MIKQTKIVSGFSGCGKTYLSKINHNKIIYDLGCSKFDKSNFTQSYIDEIKNMIGKVDILLISTHKSLRDALVENDIYYTLVFPKKELKIEYINRYKNRTTTQRVINMIDENWYKWHYEMKNQLGCDKIILESGQYLSDVINLDNI